MNNKKILSINFSKPYIKYETTIEYSNLRKIVTFEWLCLELIYKYKNNPCFCNISLQDLLINVFNIMEPNKTFFPIFKRLINKGMIGCDNVYGLQNISLKDCDITEEGIEFLRTEKIPDEGNEISIDFVYDILKNKLELHSKNLNPISSDILLCDSDNIELDKITAKEVLKNSKKFSWLNETTAIRSIKETRQVKEYETIKDNIILQSDGNISLEKNNEEIFIKKATEYLLENQKTIKQAGDFNYDNFMNIKEIIDSDKVGSKLKNIEASECVFINLKLGDKELKSRLVIKYASDEFKVEIENKQLIVYVTDEMVLNNCFMLNQNYENICFANFGVYNDYEEQGKIHLAYTLNSKNNFIQNINTLISKYIKDDFKILLLSLFKKDAFKDDVLSWFDSLKLQDGLIKLKELLDLAKDIKLNSDESLKVLNYILLNNKIAKNIDNIDKFIEYITISELKQYEELLQNIIFKNYDDVIKLFKFNSKLDFTKISRKYYGDFLQDLSDKDDLIEITQIEKSINNYKKMQKELKEYLEIKSMNDNVKNKINLKEISEIQSYFEKIDKDIQMISTETSRKREDIKSIFYDDVLKEIEDIFNDESLFKYNKIYILDTNVLIDESNILDSFKESDIAIISDIVLDELDRKKQELPDVRVAIDNIIAKKPKIIQYKDTGALVIDKLEENINDKKIINIANFYKKQYQNKDVLILTSDKNMQNYSKISNIQCQTLSEFLNPKKEKNKKKKGKK